MPCGTVEFVNFSRWFGAFRRCANKNVDRTQLIKTYCLRALGRACLPLSRAFRGVIWVHGLGLGNTGLIKWFSYRLLFTQYSNTWLVKMRLFRPEVQHQGAKRVTILRTPKSPKNVTSTFFNTVHLLPKDSRFEHGGAAPGLFLASVAI